MRVLSIPTLASMKSEQSGIKRVVEAYVKYLTEDYGVTFITDKKATYDVSVGHAGTAIGADVMHCHGLYWTSDYSAAQWEWAVNRNVKDACVRAKVITVPSSWVAETFQRDMRVNPVVIPHGIDWDDFQLQYGAGNYILWNKNRKGDVCDPTPIGKLADMNRTLPFITTFGPDKQRDNITEIGVVPHRKMKEWVGEANVYLATTKETFGIGILEAMASGVPVLGFSHGGIIDLVIHGETGYLAKPGDFEDLNEGLHFCMNHRHVLSENAREHAKKFTWEKSVEKVYEVYQDAMLEQAPTASIIIPCYNYADKVGRAIESAVNQDYALLEEIVIVDDGSDDEKELIEVVRKFQNQDPRVKLIRTENGGVALARNNGILSTGSKYVCCLDADDAIEREYLTATIPALEADKALGIAYTGLRYFLPDGDTGVSKWPEEWNYDRQLKRQNQVPTCCVFRREMFDRLGGYRQRYAPKGAGSEDADFWTRSGAYGWASEKVTSRPLFLYAWQSGRVSGDPDYQEVDWLQWHPWAKDKQHPFPSHAAPLNLSHPVRQYDTPMVSVVIPVGPGHEKFLMDALDSLEAQTYRDWEAIVYWDQDNPVPDWYLKAYPYVKWLNGKGSRDRLGAGAARNAGVEIARAPFLLFLDADDYLYPNMLRYMFDAWQEYEAIIYTDYVGKAIVEDVKKLAPDLQTRVYERDEETLLTTIGFHSADYDCDRAQQQPPPSGRPYLWAIVTCLIPKTWHNDIGGFDEEMHSWEDVDYQWRMAKAGKCFIRIPDELMCVRFTTGMRRDAGLQDIKGLVSYLREKYKEIKIVGCGCKDNGKYKTSSRPQVARVGARNVPIPTKFQKENERMSDQDFVLARYKHPNRGLHKVIGGTTKTDYGRRSGGQTFLVHKDDVIGQPHLFEAVETSVPKPEEKPLPPPTPVEAPPLVEEFDLQLLPGMNKNIKAEMEKAGLTTVEAIMEAGYDGLVAVKFIGEAKAALMQSFVIQLAAEPVS